MATIETTRKAIDWKDFNEKYLMPHGLSLWSKGNVVIFYAPSFFERSGMPLSMYAGFNEENGDLEATLLITQDAESNKLYGEAYEEFMNLLRSYKKDHPNTRVEVGIFKHTENKEIKETDIKE